MGCFPTKEQRNSESSTIEKLEQHGLRESLQVERQSVPVFYQFGRQKCEVFEVEASEHEKSKSKIPDNLFIEHVSPTLTKEKIDEKQSKADKNRQQHLDAKKKTAVKLSEVRIQRNSEEERIAKTNLLAEKQARAADNRKKQLENVKTAARNSRGIVCEDRSREKAEKTWMELEKKMAVTEENRQRIVDDVVRKQRLREEHAEKVRHRVSSWIK